MIAHVRRRVAQAFTNEIGAPLNVVAVRPWASARFDGFRVLMRSEEPIAPDALARLSETPFAVTGLIVADVEAIDAVRLEALLICT